VDEKEGDNDSLAPPGPSLNLQNEGPEAQFRPVSVCRYRKTASKPDTVSCDQLGKTLNAF